MGYRTRLRLVKNCRKVEIVNLLDQLEELDCTARWLPGANEVEVEVPDDGYTWIVTGGLSRLLDAHPEVVTSEARFTDALPPSFDSFRGSDNPASSVSKGGKAARDDERAAHLEIEVERLEK